MVLYLLSDYTVLFIRDFVHIMNISKKKKVVQWRCDQMIVIKVILIIPIVFFVLWTLLGLIQCFHIPIMSLIGDMYDAPFPIIRLIILITLIATFVLL